MCVSDGGGAASFSEILATWHPELVGVVRMSVFSSTGGVVGWSWMFVLSFGFLRHLPYSDCCDSACTHSGFPGASFGLFFSRSVCFRPSSPSWSASDSSSDGLFLDRLLPRLVLFQGIFA